MKRRESLKVLLGGMALPGSLRAALKIDVMEAAALLIQKQIEAGVLDAAVMLVRRGDDMFERVFGKAESAEVMFLLGSITKPMTATGVMVLVDRGELRLTDRVVKFIPEFSEGARKEITMQQLLTHTSGLPDQLPDNNVLRQRHAPLAEFVREVVSTPLLFEPGTKYHYQSMGILLAAEVAQRITQQPLPDLLAKEVFAPLGMKRSALGLGEFTLADTVRVQMEHAAPEAGGGAAEAREWDWNSAWWRALGVPWGGAHCSAADVTRFLNCFLHPDGKVLHESTARLMIQDQTPGLEVRRGLGFAVGPHGLGKGCSEKTFGHSGSTGMIAWADPEKDMSCVILTSLPLRASGDLFLHAASDAVAEAA